jgi:hypothetical protein
VFLGHGAAFERAKVASLAGAGVLFAGVKPILVGTELANHGVSHCSYTGCNAGVEKDAIIEPAGQRSSK